MVPEVEKLDCEDRKFNLESENPDEHSALKPLKSMRNRIVSFEEFLSKVSCTTTVHEVASTDVPEDKLNRWLCHGMYFSSLDHPTFPKGSLLEFGEKKSPPTC